MGNENKLKNKVALVSGAGSGIGLELAKELGRQGAMVIGTDINQHNLDNMASDLKRNGFTCHTYKVDHANFPEVENFAKKVMKDIGEVDILCCNAGVGHGAKVHTIPLEDWKWIIDINLWGVIYLLHFFLPSMVQRKQGEILITASGAGLCPLGGMAPYSMTKAALVSLTSVMRMELTQYNINVSALCPGIIKTNIMKASRGLAGKNRDAATELYETKGFRPEKVAKKAVRGLLKHKAFIYIPWGQVAIPYILYRFSPSLVIWISRQLFKKGRNLIGPFFTDDYE